MASGQDGTDRLPPGVVTGSWLAAVIVGALTLILGLIVALHPSTSVNVIAVLLGILTILSGIFHLIRVFDPEEAHRVWLGIAGLLFIVIGVILIRHLHLTRAIIGLIIGITWIVQGLAALIGGISGGVREGRLVDHLRRGQSHRRDRRDGHARVVAERPGHPARDLVHGDGCLRDHRRAAAAPCDSHHGGADSRLTHAHTGGGACDGWRER